MPGRGLEGRDFLNGAEENESDARVDAGKSRGSIERLEDRQEPRAAPPVLAITYLVIWSSVAFMWK